MAAMSVQVAVVPGPPVAYVASASIEEEDEGIESPAVRASVEEAFLRCTHPTGGNGFLVLSDLLGFLKSSGRAVLWNEAKLVSMLDRCELLTLSASGLVLWTGGPERSFVLRRLRTIVAARKSKLSISSVLVQLQRGTERLSPLVAADIEALAGAMCDFNVVGGAIERSEAFQLQASDVLEADEFLVFRILQRTQFTLSAGDIALRLGRRKLEAETVHSILRESAVITDVDGGYRSIIEVPTQLGMRL